MAHGWRDRGQIRRRDLGASAVTSKEEKNKIKEKWGLDSKDGFDVAEGHSCPVRPEGRMPQWR